MPTLRSDLSGFSIDPDERKAAESDAAVTIIGGGLTAGKFHTLVARMAFLLGLGVGHERIACITSTGTAASSFGHLMKKHPRVATVGNRFLVGTPTELAIPLVRLFQGNEALNVPINFSVWTGIEAVDVMTCLRDMGKKSNVTSKGIREAIAWGRRNQWPGSLCEGYRMSDDQHSRIPGEYRERKRWQRVIVHMESRALRTLTRRNFERKTAAFVQSYRAKNVASTGSGGTAGNSPRQASAECQSAGFACPSSWPAVGIWMRSAPGATSINSDRMPIAQWRARMKNQYRGFSAGYSQGENLAKPPQRRNFTPSARQSEPEPIHRR